MIRVTEDTYMHKGMRKKLLDSLRARGIKSEQVLQALNEVPRHYFMDQALSKIAYEDRAFPIDCNQTISQPFIVALQSELLDIKKFDKVLEVGTGSAYQATVLAALGAQVFTIERHKPLYEEVQKFFPFKKKYPNIKFFYGDGYKGLPSFAPFDKIIITAAAPEFVIKDLFLQLKPNGIIVAPIGEGEQQEMIRYTKGPRGGIQQQSFGACSFVPMLKGME